ncbi:MAG TPA: YcaO-like family protein, partial [Thermohalobaculum sp.]|nr:YcaO-like family protein [Thermohalobaculum sp.]
MLDPSAQAPESKTFRRGTHRACPPAETLARVKPLMAAFGITRVANLTGLDRLNIPVVMVCRPNARSSAVFHGKGLDLDAARASGVMEAIETWHAEHVDLPLRLGPARDMGRHATVDVERLPRLPESRFEPELPMLWVEGEDLMAGTPAWVPFDVVHADGTLGPVPGSGCFSASTNGLASGNRYHEAVVHALTEVIERDGTSIWHRLPPARQAAARLDLRTVDDPGCRAVLDLLEAGAMDVAVWEITTDVGVPAFQCLIADRTRQVAHIGTGAGCHPAREVALLRALTEAAQVRMTYIVGSREDIAWADYAGAALERRRASARALLGAGAGARAFDAAPTHASASFEDDVEWLLGRLRAAGIAQAVAVDLTRPEFGIPVVRVIVPGLEGSDHHEGYLP